MDDLKIVGCRRNEGYFLAGYRRKSGFSLKGGYALPFSGPKEVDIRL